MYHNFLMIIFRWGHLKCPSWSAAGTSRASRCFSRWDFFCKTLYRLLVSLYRTCLGCKTCWCLLSECHIFSATQAVPTLLGRQLRWARTVSMARLSWRKGIWWKLKHMKKYLGEGIYPSPSRYCLTSILPFTGTLKKLDSSFARYSEDLELEDAVHTAILTLKVPFSS